MRTVRQGRLYLLAIGCLLAWTDPLARATQMDPILRGAKPATRPGRKTMKEKARSAAKGR
jgi:hypothetical protein